MSKLQVYDPAMCCSTGVCGPSIDPVLPRFSADLEWLKSKGVEVERTTWRKMWRICRESVKQALNSQGTKCLPMNDRWEGSVAGRLPHA